MLTIERSDHAMLARPIQTILTVKSVSRRARPDAQSELWSAFGYDTMCLFWNLPVRAFRALSEAERQRLVRVSNRIDDLSPTDKDGLLREIGEASPVKRLAVFRRLARGLVAGKPLVAKSRPTRRARITT
jgi:hypothetical protein